MTVAETHTNDASVGIDQHMCMTGYLPPPGHLPSVTAIVESYRIQFGGQS